MSYGHAHNLNAKSDQAEPGASPADDPAQPVDPALYRRDDVRPVLAERDITELYRVLKGAGLTQRQMAALTDQSQSEVSEILKGRRVRDVTVLERICDGLGIPRELMGLSYGEHSAYRGQGTVASPEEVAEMLRRHLIALGPIAAVAYHPLTRLAELLEHVELPGLSPVPLPSRLSGVHVAQVRELTRRLGEAGNTSVSDPEVLSAAAAWANRLLDVSGPESVRKALMVAVAELHIEAGWAGFDAGLYDRAMVHYAYSFELAIKAGDTYLQALILKYAGTATVEHGQPNDGLKMLQYGAVTAIGVPLDEPRAVVVGESGRAAIEATVLVDEATALVSLDCWDAADTAVARARELWEPTPADPYGDLDRPAASLELERGRLDAAEPFAVASMRRWESGSQVSRAQSAIVLATIHVRAGEPRWLQLAHGAVTAAAKLTSVRVRRRLEPLITALEARPGSDYRQLARMARQVAATRA
jgi:transcriptional regulator with XRE-family HTH domain